MAEIVVRQEETGTEMALNMGPHHPSTHGVLRFIIKSDGEIINKAAGLAVWPAFKVSIP